MIQEGRRRRAGRGRSNATRDEAAPPTQAHPAPPEPAPAVFDWAALMRGGMGELGLHPSAFWALTPVELLIMLGLEGGQAPLSRARLEELAALYPDRNREQVDGGDRGSGRAHRGAGDHPCGGAGGDGGV